MENYPVIYKLSSELVNHIAAGEVIERPASAIKEIIDNAIDALANKIYIKITSPDARSFQIIDNGIGIHPEQLGLAFTLHATSKINKLDDLNKITTKGFRGEALASISAVADVSCVTKHVTQELARKVTFDSEGIIQISNDSLNQGTLLRVDDLFRKIPARLKFLKRPETELQCTIDSIRDIAIAHPEISFELIVKNKEQFQTSGSGDWFRAIEEVFQEKIEFQYLETQLPDKNITFKGLVAPISYAKADPKSIITLVNQRPIQCPIMRKAVREVYSGILPRNKYPRIILNLEIPPEEVDVNVHPTKREVRYSNGNDVFLLVKQSIEKHLILHSAAMPKQEIVITPLVQNVSAEPALFEKSTLPDVPNIDSIIQKPQEKSQSGTVRLEKSNNESVTGNVDDKIDNILNRVKKKHQPTENNILEVKDFCLSMRSDSQQSLSDEYTNYMPLDIKSENSSLTGQLTFRKNIPFPLRESFYRHLDNWLLELEQYFMASSEQMHLIDTPTKEQHFRRTPPLATLKAVWARDNWRCVYCGKYLLEPKLIRKALPLDPDSWISKLTAKNQVTKVHVFREHVASYDHLIPYSKVSSLNDQVDNLYSCCKACNQAKNDSMDYHKWQPKKYPAWQDQNIQIGNIRFSNGDENASFTKVI